MATPKMFKYLQITMNLCPSSIIRFDLKSNTIWRNSIKLSRLYKKSMAISTINILFLVTYMIHRILETPKSITRNIQIASITLPIAAWPLSLVGIYTLMANSGYFVLMTNMMITYYQTAIGNKLNLFLYLFTFYVKNLGY